jgi:hypothetical protein
MCEARITVPLAGKNKEFMVSLVSEVEMGVQGKRITEEGAKDVDSESDEDTWAVIKDCVVYPSM